MTVWRSGLRHSRTAWTQRKSSNTPKGAEQTVTVTAVSVSMTRWVSVVEAANAAASEPAPGDILGGGRLRNVSGGDGILGTFRDTSNHGRRVALQASCASSALTLKTLKLFDEI